MKPVVPLWSVISEIIGLFVLAVGTCAYMKLGFVPEQLQSPGYPYALAAIGVLMGFPKLYFGLKNSRQQAE